MGTIPKQLHTLYTLQAVKKGKREKVLCCSVSQKTYCKIHLWSESNSTRAAFQYKQKQNNLKEDRKQLYHCKSMPWILQTALRISSREDINNCKRYRLRTEDRTLHFVNKTEWLQKSCNIKPTEDCEKHGLEYHSRKEFINPRFKIHDATWEDTSEIIRLQIYKPGSSNTSEEKVQLWGSFPQDTMESKSTRVHRGMRQNSQRTGPFGRYLKVPELPTVQLLTCYVSYILPNYSLMPQRHRLLGCQQSLLSCLSPWKLIQETGERLETFKLSQWPQETDSQHAKKDTRTKFII